MNRVTLTRNAVKPLSFIFLTMLLAFPMTGFSKELQVCTDGLNLRDDSLENVITVLPLGTKVESIGSEIKTRMGHDYKKFAVEGSSNSGWLATGSSFLCTAQQKVVSNKIVISLSKNKLYYYENNELIRSWNVGTARPGKVTPTGSYTIWNKDVCPPYYGSLGDKNVPGCTAANPFGPKALWFKGYMYGIHGTNQPSLIAEGTSASSRRVSSGCIRNQNANIEWLFARVKTGDRVIIKQ